VLLLAIFTLPLIGAILAERNLAELLHFPPPLRIPQDYLDFSWFFRSI